MNSSLPAALGAVLDVVVEELAADVAELRAAQSEYSERRGRVFEDEELWEPWTQALLEWAAIERSWSGGASPVARRLASCGAGTERELLLAWARSHRTVVEILELGREEVHVRDLVGGAQFLVHEERRLFGVGAGDVAEVRLIGVDGRVCFGRTFLYHPAGTRSTIANVVADMLGAGADRVDVVDHCASLRIRCERYKHVPPLRIYRAPPEQYPIVRGDPSV